MKRLLITIGFFCLLANVKAQDIPQRESYTMIILNNGSKFHGEIVDWKYGESVTIKTKWDTRMVIPESDIRKLIEKERDYFVKDEDGNYVKYKAKNPYTYEEKGIYYSADLSLIYRNMGRRGSQNNGVGFSVSAGKKFNRLFTLGGGIGYDNYFWDSGESFVPIFVETRGFVHPTNQSLFYRLKLGGAIGVEDEDFELTQSTGGLFMHPAIGYRWGKKNTKMTLDLGYKIQHANLVYENAWSSSDQNITYRRLTLTLGVLL